MGTISYAPNLNQVAERRIENGWGLESIEGYDLLIAPADCAFLGKDGWLFVESRVYRVVVVDCSQEKHKQAMIDNGLLVDVNQSELVHKIGWLVLNKK